MATTPQPSPFVLATSAAQIGTSVKAARGMLGWSQHQAASKAGVGYRFYRELETGKATVRLDKVFRVLRALSLTLAVIQTAPRPGP